MTLHKFEHQNTSTIISCKITRNQLLFVMKSTNKRIPKNKKEKRIDTQIYMVYVFVTCMGAKKEQFY